MVLLPFKEVPEFLLSQAISLVFLCIRLGVNVKTFVCWVCSILLFIVFTNIVQRLLIILGFDYDDYDDYEYDDDYKEEEDCDEEEEEATYNIVEVINDWNNEYIEGISVIAISITWVILAFCLKWKIWWYFSGIFMYLITEVLYFLYYIIKIYREVRQK